MTYAGATAIQRNPRIETALSKDGDAVAVHEDGLATVLRQPHAEAMLRDQNARAAIRQHEVDSLLRIGRIDRNIACPGLHDRQERDNGIRRSLYRDGDAIPGCTPSVRR